MAFLPLVQAETRFSDLCVCMLTGGDLPAANERVLGLGALCVLGKPRSVPEFEVLRDAVFAVSGGSVPPIVKAMRGAR